MQNLFERKSINTEENNKKSGLKIFLILLFIVVFFVITFYYKYQSFKTDVLVEDTQIISIKSGDTFNSISEKIDGVSGFWFDLYLNFNTPDYELQVGRYEIKENSNINDVINSLKEPIPEQEINVTILEGRNIYDIDEYLADLGIIEANEYVNYVTSSEKIEKLTEYFPFLGGINTLEGYLYPDTYAISLNNFEVRKLVVDKQLTAFEEKVYNKLLKNMDNKSIEELINLASIVEKEEKNSSEKATVAGILKKRLETGWMIGADITVCYPHELTSQQCKMVVSKYINEKSSYNTRTMVGLPKTPISNPSYETIEATLNYKETPYWFYLHNVSTGKIYYAETNAEHESNKKFMY
ncbi:MAG: endolytic transglycosylase MltG [Candidatus Gracilibacteria bacterium]|nr:endolytic transglycosylase MltG [Candidatus Gracilibacteria bacterium]